MSYLSHSQATPVTPLYDTWKWKQNIGAWLISLPFDRSAYIKVTRVEEWRQEINGWISSVDQEYLPDAMALVNGWFANQLEKNLDSFNHWVRIWKVDIGHERSLEWDSTQSHEDFLKNVFKKVQDYPALLSHLSVHVDMLVYTRTEQSPHQPVHAWIRNYAKFSISSMSDSTYTAFQVYCTLFCRYSPDFDDNEELYNLNHPMLSASLQAWEKQCGEIDADDGLFGMYPHGFSPDWNK